jgi:adenylate cyclase
MPDELRLTLLGKPQITLGGSEVSGFTYRKSLALLFYLAVTGRPHSRDTLIGLLWPEAREANARSNLRKTLTDLRRRVGPFLAITRHDVAFEPNSPYWLDTASFEANVADTTAKDIERLQEAVNLYRGDFLEGFYIRQTPAFEEWVLVQRTRLRESALRALHTLAIVFGTQGASGRAAAIDYTTHLLALEPWSEEAHRQLMQLLALSGRRGAALAQYEVCRQMLADELGVEPGRDTTRLYEQIRDGELRVEHPSLVSRERQLDVAAQTPVREDVPERARPVFVARERELAHLDACLDAALDGRGHVVFITGGPGRGKTALMHNFARRATTMRSDLVVAVGNCNAYSGVGDPYLPFRQILAALTGDTAGALSREHARRLRSTVPLAVQVLLEYGPYLIDSLVPGASLLDRARAAAPATGNRWLRELTDWVERDRTKGSVLEPSALLAQVSETLYALAERLPLLLVLDDLQWSDTGSASLLFHLGRRLAEPGRHPILVAGAYRPEEIALGYTDSDDGQHPLWQVLAELARLFGDTSLDLARLEEAENRTFVDAIVDAEPNNLREGFRADLYDRTAGHPLFTVELLRAMQERGDLVQDEGVWMAGPSLDWGHLPARVEAVIQGRVGRLNEQQNELLSVASVEGEIFTAQVLAHVLDMSERQALRALAFDLESRHLLVREAGEEKIAERHISRYRFTHALYQEFLYQRLSPGERRLLHNQVGSALEDLYEDQADEIAIQLALHFADADVPEKAVHYFGRAAASAARVFASSEAIDHYRRALEWAGRIKVDSECLIELYVGLGRAHELNSEFDHAVSVYEEMARVARGRSDRAMELASLMGRVAIQAVPTSVHDPVSAQITAEKALTIAGALGDAAAEAKILWSISLAYFFDNRLAQAIEYGERSLALARQYDLRDQMAQTLNDLGSFCYMYSGRIEQAKDALQEATALWRELGNSPMLADSLSSSSVAHIYAGEFDRAVAASEEAFEISQSIDNPWGKSYSQWKLGLVYAEWGEWSRALDIMQECTRLGELAGFMPSQTYTRADMAALYGEIGATGRGMDTVRIALSVGESHVHLTDRAPVLGVVAYLHLIDGDLAAATDAIEEAKSKPYLETWRAYGISIRLTDAQIALAKGENERAAAVAEGLLADLRDFGTRAKIPYALYLLGSALAELGKPEDARERWLEARREAEALGSRRILWRVLHALSRIETDSHESARLRDGARQVLAYIADHLEQEELRESFVSQAEVLAVLETR